MCNYRTSIRAFVHPHPFSSIKFCRKLDSLETQSIHICTLNISNMSLRESLAIANGTRSDRTLRGSIRRNNVPEAGLKSGSPVYHLRNPSVGDAVTISSQGKLANLKCRRYDQTASQDASTAVQGPRGGAPGNRTLNIFWKSYNGRVGRYPERDIPKVKPRLTKDTEFDARALYEAQLQQHRRERKKARALEEARISKEAKRLQEAATLEGACGEVCSRIRTGHLVLDDKSR